MILAISHAKKVVIPIFDYLVNILLCGLQKIADLLQERHTAYESVADITVKVDGKTIKEVVQEIVEVLNHENIGD